MDKAISVHMYTTCYCYNLGTVCVYVGYCYCYTSLHCCRAGLADPNALTQAVAAFQGCHFLGMPECEVCTVLSAIVYLNFIHYSYIFNSDGQLI